MQSRSSPRQSSTPTVLLNVKTMPSILSLFYLHNVRCNTSSTTVSLTLLLSLTSSSSMRREWLSSSDRTNARSSIPSVEVNFDPLRECWIEILGMKLQHLVGKLHFFSTIGAIRSSTLHCRLFRAWRPTRDCIITDICGLCPRMIIDS